MTARAFDPLRLDVEAFAAEGGRLSGTWALAELDRLRDSTTSGGGPPALEPIHWSAAGERRVARGNPQTWLHLQAATTVPLECQRCLGAVDVTLDVDRRVRFVPGEDQAAQLDEESDDDVLATARALDLRVLIEDELLLALPLVPRHETCPHPLLVREDEPDEAPNPFAALAALKRGNGPN